MRQNGEAHKPPGRPIKTTYLLVVFQENVENVGNVGEAH
jgi:hypothetical protein